MGFFSKFGDAIISGGASLVSGLVGSILGKKSNDNANQTNMEIAQMNNEWSEKMMDKQNMYNIAQWQREADFAKQQAADANAFTEYMQDKANQYNSAPAQAQRLREAGLNPALVMGGSNAGTAQGASGAQAATPSGNSVGLPSPTSATVRPYDYTSFSNAVTNSVMLALQAQKMQAEVTNTNLNNEFLRKSMENRLKEQYENMRSKRYDTDYREVNESVRVATENENYLSALSSRILAKEQITLARQAQALNNIQITHLPDQMKADIALKLATAEYQGTTDLAKDLKFFEKKYGRRITKEELRVIFDAWKQNIETQQYRGLNGVNTLVGLLNR